MGLYTALLQYTPKEPGNTCETTDSDSGTRSPGLSLRREENKWGEWGEGLPWRSGGWDSVLPMQGAWVHPWSGN